MGKAAKKNSRASVKAGKAVKEELKVEVQSPTREESLVAEDVADPPRKPMSSFLYFCLEMRAKARAKKVAVEKSRILARQWRKLTDEEKKPFRDLAEAARKQYNKAMEQFNKNS